PNLKDTIGALRAPWALVLFHSRLKETKGKEREELLQTSKGIVESILKGTLWQDRHDEASNPHLKKIFEGRPDLKQKWLNPPKGLSVKDLYPQASERFEDYSVIDCEDPSDI